MSEIVNPNTTKTPKYKKGFTVEILSRKIIGNNDIEVWENSYVGHNGIIIYSNLGPYRNNFPNICYNLLILEKNSNLPTTQSEWYEEKYLKLICCNPNRGYDIMCKFGNLKPFPYL